MKRCLVVITGILLCVPSAFAENKTGQTPALGVETTATVGSPAIEKFRYDSVRIGVARTDIVRRTITGDIRINAGDPLYPVSSRAKFKACSTSGPCALDDDGDGTFDRIALDDMVAALKLKEPVPYEIKDAVAPSSTGNFKQVIIYLGTSSDTLRLSYREFLNDMARPAFTEELTFPLSKIYPQKIALKDSVITILAIDGLGMHYRVER
jgi:hypothetical protein